MHIIVHVPQTKDHALIFGPKNQRVIRRIYTATVHTSSPYLEPSTGYVETAAINGREYTDEAESEESLEPEDLREAT